LRHPYFLSRCIEVGQRSRHLARVRRRPKKPLES
jgi:hypothetical protein